MEARAGGTRNLFIRATEYIYQHLLAPFQRTDSSTALCLAYAESLHSFHSTDLEAQGSNIFHFKSIFSNQALA